MWYANNCLQVDQTLNCHTTCAEPGLIHEPQKWRTLQARSAVAADMWLALVHADLMYVSLYDVLFHDTHNVLSTCVMRSYHFVRCCLSVYGLHS